VSVTAIRAFGVFTFVVTAASIFARIGPREWIFGTPPKIAFISATVFLIIGTSVGVGLLLLRKWAAVLFSLGSLAIPVLMAIDSAGQVSAGFYLMLIAATVVLFMPVIIIVRSWRLLS
jgi:hypothetical protein